MIKVRVYRKGEELSTVPVADLSEVRRDPEVLIWVDVVSPTREELAAMGEEFELHPLVLETLSTRNLRPKIEQFKDYVMLVCYTVERAVSGPHAELLEVDLVSGRTSWSASTAVCRSTPRRSPSGSAPTPSWPARAAASCSTWCSTT